MMTAIQERDRARTERDRARNTLARIRGIVVALDKGIGSERGALKSISTILHVRKRRSAP